MTILLMLFISLFIIGIQAAVPYLLKPTIAFGVTVPSTHIKDTTLATYKKTLCFMDCKFWYYFNHCLYDMGTFVIVLMKRKSF